MNIFTSCKSFRRLCSYDYGLVRSLYLPAKDVRNFFLDYFVKENNHTFIPSSSVIPFNDPSLLFVNAGMNQFKSVFLDQVPSGTWLHSLKSAANSQKCIRVGGKHNDLSIVGQDVYHHTFFEMLGNWSFGKYFKKEACSMAWQLLTEVYCLPKERLYVTYFGGDESRGLGPDYECKEVWQQLGVPEEHILPFGMGDNFWEMGKCGPCGPCTEIHYDHCPSNSIIGRLRVNTGRSDMTEIWNIVFIQFNRVDNGDLQNLKTHHVDTGMGLERITAILQNTLSNYDTDLFKPLFDVIQRKGNVKPYGGLVGTDKDAKVDSAYRLVADHSRMITVALADGLLPDEVAAGRVIRKALLTSKHDLNGPKGLLKDLAIVVSNELGETYPELVKNLKKVKNIIAEEEEKFLKIVNNAANVMNKMLSVSSSSQIFSGENAWNLYFVHGLQEELIELMVAEYGLKVDWETFNHFRNEEKKKSKMFSDIDQMNSLRTVLISLLKNKNLPPTNDAAKYQYKYLDNYVFEPMKCKVLAIIKGNELTNEVGVGDKFSLVLDQTNFFSEAGGQDGDKGYVVTNNTVCFIGDTQTICDYVLHIGIVEKGFLRVGQEINLQLDENHRKGCMLNHTATHLLNKVIKETLPNSIQKSSNVSSSYFRFDFTCKGGLNYEIVTKLENYLNQSIKMSLPVQTNTLTLLEAQNEDNLIVIPGEIYPDFVNLITIQHPHDEQWTSKELCCGTHVFNTNHLEHFVIVGQKALSQTVRSIRAMTGSDAKNVLEESQKVESLTNELGNNLEILKETNSFNYEEFDKNLQEIRRIRTILKNVTIALRSKMKIETQLEELELKINSLIRKYHKTTFNDLLNEEWKFVEDIHKDKDYIVAALKTPGNDNFYLKYLNSIDYQKPALSFFKGANGTICCLAWVPKEYQRKISAEAWVNSVSSTLQNRTFAKSKNAKQTFLAKGMLENLQPTLKVAVDYVENKLRD